MTPWKWALVAVGVIALVIGGVALGRFALPGDVEQKAEVRIKENATTNAVTTTDRQATKKRRRETTHYRPDGTVATKTVATTDDATTTKAVETKIEYRDRIVEKTIETKIATRPNWIVSVGAGVSVPTLLGQGETGIPGMRGAVVNVDISRRILGPFYGGVWANTQGGVGLSVSGAW